jgi:RimJ/RimL family protein N-acetyltransferase
MAAVFPAAALDQLGWRGELPYGRMMNGNHAASDEPIVILTTPRLILRTAIESDIPILQERVFGDGDVMRHAFAGVPMARGEAENFMRSHFTFGGSLTGLATLAERPTGDILGFAGLLPSAALGTDDFEIGFVLSRHAWGRGIATEIGEAQLAFGFDRLACHRLLGLVEPRNAPSIRALGKLGMKHLKDIAQPQRANRSVYVIEAEEWRRRRSE